MDIRSLFKGTKGTKKFKAGKTIFKEGTVGDLMYVVLDGELEVSVGGKLVEVAKPGDVVGEMALIDTKSRSATVVADTPVVAIRLFKSSFDRVIKQEPKVAAKILAVVARRLRDAESTISS